MADPGTEDFECSVKWTTGIIDTVLLTELILPFNLHLEWRHDSAWRGVLLRSWRVLRGERLPECEFIEHYHGVFGVKTPLQYFEQYFTDDFINEMCYKAVHYRVTKDPNSTFTVSAAEMRTYLGVVLYMTLVKLGGVRRYWCSSTRINLIADVITRDRFEAITKSLHFETETPSPTVSAKTKKFQRIVDQFNDVAATIYLEENLSVDEQIIAYKGRKSSLRQYNPRKPKKWGWKVFVLSGSYLGRFRVTTHFRTRAYLKIFLNFVNIIATNCWAQYRRDANEKATVKKTRCRCTFSRVCWRSLCVKPKHHDRDGARVWMKFL